VATTGCQQVSTTLRPIQPDKLTRLFSLLGSTAGIGAGAKLGAGMLEFVEKPL
jgi:hypothetical protein